MAVKENRLEVALKLTRRRKKRGAVMMYEPLLVWNLFLMAARLPGESLELTT